MQKLLLAILCVLGYTVRAQVPVLSNQAEISVLTMGPDQNDLVQAFGHSAYRVSDPVNGFNFAFNYGVFSFNQPNFYLNFARGHNLYYLGVASYDQFIEPYVYYNRSVHEQVLSLTQDQKQKIFEYLYWNAKPENRNYLYDYFFNNCATKIRDVLTTALGSDIEFDTTWLKTDYTIRQLTDLYLEPLPWGDLGIDIGLGSLIDRRASASEYMFLPDFIESSFDHATVNMLGNFVPLVGEKKLLFTPKKIPAERSMIHPWTAFGSLLLIGLVLSAWDLKRKKASWWFDGILLLTLGLVGVVLLLLWTATDHHACAKNYNLLWALPTHLVALIFIFRKNKPAWLKKYFLGTAMLSLLLLLAWHVLPQMLNVFLIPVVAVMLVRSATLYKLMPAVKAKI